jgi:hypothetical protein
LSSRRTAFFLEPDAKVVDFSSASKGKRIQTEGEIPILSKTTVFFDSISFGFDDISFSVSKI